MVELTEIKVLPEKLKAARGSISQVEAAASIGITKQRLWNYENDQGDPPSDVLARMCLLYKVSIEDLTNAEHFFAK